MEEIKRGSKVTTPNSKVVKIVEKVEEDQATVFWDDKNGVPQKETYPIALLTLKKKMTPLSRTDHDNLAKRFMP